MVNSLGFCLEKVAAMQEHGIRGDVMCLQGLAVHYLMKVSPVFFTGTWVRGILIIVGNGSPDDA